MSKTARNANNFIIFTVIGYMHLSNLNPTIALLAALPSAALLTALCALLTSALDRLTNIADTTAPTPDH